MFIILSVKVLFVVCSMCEFVVSFDFVEWFLFVVLFGIFWVVSFIGCFVSFVVSCVCWLIGVCVVSFVISSVVVFWIFFVIVFVEGSICKFNVCWILGGWVIVWVVRVWVIIIFDY